MIDYIKDTHSVVQALLATIFTWGVTALGAALVFFFKSVKKGIMDAMLGFSGGVMIAASFFSLLSPAAESAARLGYSPWLVCFASFFGGGTLLFLGDRLFAYLEKHRCECVDGVPKMRGKRSFMLIFSITLHNIPEGMAVGVAFASAAYGIDGATFAAACLLALGIGLQNFPEGTAVSIPLLREGYSRRRAFFCGQLSGAVEPIGGVLGALLVLSARSFLPFLLSFAAGAMIYVVVEELIPESQTNERKDYMALFTLLGFSVMMTLDLAL